MNSTDKSLGAELRHLRIMRGFSLRKIAADMGWKSTNPLTKIESNNRIAERETLSRLAKCLDLSLAENLLIMGLAGYYPNEPAPTLAQVKKDLGIVVSYLATWNYPAYIIDSHFNIFAANSAAISLFGLSSVDVVNLAKRKITLLDLQYDSRYNVKLILQQGNAPEYFQEQIRRFKVTNIYRQHHAFYRAYPEYMAQRLLSEDYTFFKSIWERVTIEYVANPGYAIGMIKIPLSQNETANFFLAAEHIHRFVHFFELITYKPDNIGAADLIAGMPAGDAFTIWNLPEIGDRLTSEILAEHENQSPESPKRRRKRSTAKLKGDKVPGD